MKTERDRTVKKPRYIRIPKPLQFFDGKLEFPLRDFIAHVADRHPEFVQSPAGWRLGARLLASLDAAEDGIWEIDEEDWGTLHKAIEDGRAGVPSAVILDDKTKQQTMLPLPPREFVPFADAVDQATSTPPEVTPTEN
jgi:hypothetical protein